jgi:hypothetical protein
MISADSQTYGRISSSKNEINKQLDANHFKNFKIFYLFTCTLLNMFRALLCPSSGAFPALVHRRTLKTSLRPEQHWKQHRTGHHTVNRGCVCIEGKAPDDGHNSARNMLSSVQVNK